MGVFIANNFKTLVTHDHGFSVVVNDLQHIFIRPLSDNKCYAILAPTHKVFIDIHISSDYKSLSIGFGANKSPEALFKDVNKRLISSSFCIEQFNHLTSQLLSHNKYTDKKSENIKALMDTGLDIRLHENKEKASIYFDKSYGNIEIYADSLNLTLSNLPVELALELLNTVKNFKGAK